MYKRKSKIGEKMQLKKALAAGALGALMAGSTLAFAASLSDFPAPFVQAGASNFLVVVGASAQVSDVVGAVDIAARLGGGYTPVTCAGTTAGASVSGEGKALDTATTHVFLGENLGKTGLRTTLTKDDLPTLLAKGTMTDADGTHKYDQFIDMSPGATNPNNVRIQFDKPGSSSSVDPAYNFGRFTTSPSNTEYMYKTRVVFDVAVNGTNAVGKSITIFGNDYTVSSDTSATFTGAAGNKLVLFGGANTQTLKGGQTTTVTVGGIAYTVTLLGVQSNGDAVVQVGTTTETIAKSGTSTNFGDLKVFVKESASLSTTDQTQNIATLLIGADKIILQHQSKIKKGTNEDTVDGTYVELTGSSQKLSQIAIYWGGTSSTNDFITAGDATYLNPVFKTFGINFAGMSPAVGGTSDDKLEFRNSGDNNLQLTFTDFNSNKATVNYAYKALSSGIQFSAADSSANALILAEGATVARDQYIILDAGGYPHMFKVSGVDLTPGLTSASIDLYDVFSGTTTKITTGADSQESAVIDGQTYNFVNASATTFQVFWGTGATTTVPGSYITVWPTLKGKMGEQIAFTAQNTTLPIVNNTYIQLPTGAFQMTWSTGAVTYTAVAKEDTTGSVATKTAGNLDVVAGTGSDVVYVGRTAANGVLYNISAASAGVVKFSVVGSSGTAALSQPAVIVWEEKDDAGTQAAIVVPTTLGTSGGNSLASVDNPDFTNPANSGMQPWGSNSNKASQIDLWGIEAVKDSTSVQHSLDLWYPDTQRVAQVFMLGNGASISTSGATTGQTINQVVPITAPVAKLDTEVPATSADRTGKNLVLVGGPCANSLVADLATAGKFPYTCASWPGRNFGLLQVIDDAFASGKVALVVAGTTAVDTRNAAQKLQSGVGLTGTSLEV